MNNEQLLKLFLKFKREQSRVNQWVIRVQLELTRNVENCMLTLTYDNDHLPQGGNLNVRDVQLFLKRLRKRISPQKIRYFGCSEYGSRGLRPHYHLIIFGWCPDDLVEFSYTEKGTKCYRSNFLSEVWNNGFISVSNEINPSAIPYICKYMQKFNRLPRGLKRPSILCSRKPGIGEFALRSNFIDLEYDKIYYTGKYARIPRYYLKRLGHSADEILINRDRFYRKFNEFFSNSLDDHTIFAQTSNTLVDTDEINFKKNLKSFEKWLTNSNF